MFSFSLCGRPAGMTRQRCTRALCLNTAESLQLFWFDGHLAPQANLPRRPTNERNTIRVQRLVNGRSARLSPSNRNPGTTCRLLHSQPLRLLVTATQPLDDSELHPKLDPIQRNEPDNVLPTSS